MSSQLESLSGLVLLIVRITVQITLTLLYRTVLIPETTSRKISVSYTKIEVNRVKLSSHVRLWGWNVMTGPTGHPNWKIPPPRRAEQSRSRSSACRIADLLSDLQCRFPLGFDACNINSWDPLLLIRARALNDLLATVSKGDRKSLWKDENDLKGSGLHLRSGNRSSSSLSSPVRRGWPLQTRKLCQRLTADERTFRV